MDVRTTTTPASADAERQLAELHAERARTEAGLASAEDALRGAEARLDAAQRVYDEARDAFGRATVRATVLPDWRPPAESPAGGADAVLAQAREAEAAARAAFEEAAGDLAPALVARNEIDRRRSDLTRHWRALPARIEQAEATLERARREAGPARDLLATIRRRLDRVPRPAPTSGR